MEVYEKINIEVGIELLMATNGNMQMKNCKNEIGVV